MDGGQLMRLDAYQQRATRGELTETEARAWYELVTDVWRQSDYYERALIRHLKWGWGMKWREVAELVGVTTRQAAFQRWRRLIGPRPGAGTYQQQHK